ncbi:LacI family DNA-binding transcriptional regulator [Fibrivirga algicola]|uniref:LacI family DNA-binding transcriptional regulator n=1 Tax=Fibrivirga algicola TaxID=2950420 RepID=A0ABX0QAP7_9BACT|nr:LacI family DNA-binding transcriptional regulator [Fibrivirga algicola]NID09341.1 LacI family DNA-binding transcriptional regulator [Fibrivirga algicola]
MGRHKGSGPAVVLTRKELNELAADVRRLGNNVIARQAGISINGMSLIINGKNNASIATLKKIRTAISELEEIKTGGSKPEKKPVAPVATPA